MLDKIVASKKKEIEKAKQRVGLSELRRSFEATAGPKRSLTKALRENRGVVPALIAEIKKSSPSRGLIREDFDPLGIAQIYQEEGACALSVLTDEPFFSGSLSILKEVRAKTVLPVLRKDFILDPYQVYESALAGADSLLLIVHLLEFDELKTLLKTTHDCQMEALVEVHTEPEIKQAVDAGVQILGVNNRDLTTMKVDLRTAERLARQIPKGAVGVAESGIRTHEDYARFKQLGFQGVLIGEALMEARDIRGKLQDIMHGAH